MNHGTDLIILSENNRLINVCNSLTFRVNPIQDGKHKNGYDSVRSIDLKLNLVVLVANSVVVKTT